MHQFVLTENIDRISKKEEISKAREIEYIFEAYYKRIYNYIYYRVNDHHTTEDLVSTVFEKIITKQNTYSEKKSPFEVWMFAIAKNTVNDYFRKYKRQRIFSISSLKEMTSKEKTPEEKIVTEESSHKLIKALDILKPRERNIIALKFGANLKNIEIAELLSITESNIGVILYRSMKKLKKEIEREELV